MANNFFRFKQFTVYQDRCAMKVTTDACIFGALVEGQSEGAALDIGTGSGLLALMIAQKCGGTVDAIEVDALAAEQARANFKSSRFPALRLIEADYLQHQLPPAHYQLICCNPPFFEDHKPTNKPRVNLARHNNYLTPSRLLQKATRELHPEGSLWMMLPPAQMNKTIQNMLPETLYANQRFLVYHRQGMQASRAIVRFSFINQPLTNHEIFIFDKDSGEYTEITSNLLSPFYLHL